jgi:flagellar biosynthesis protein FlhG
VRQDATALEAVRQQTPLLKLAPKAPAAKDILALAAKIQRARESTLEGLAEASILSHLGPRP